MAAPFQSTVVLGDALGNEMVKLFVGPERKEFTVHKKLICDVSDFFQKGFTGNFLEGQQSVMDLPEDSPGTVAIFIHWLYASVVPSAPTEAHLHNLFDLYNFAEKLCLPKLRDTTMDTIQDMAHEYSLRKEIFAPTLLDKARRNPTKNVGLFRFCCECMAYFYYLQAKKYPDPVPEDEYHTDDTDGENDTIYWRQQDVEHMLKCSKGDAVFMRIVMDSFAFVSNMEKKDYEEEGGCDPTAPRAEDLKDHCYNHCHDRNVDCRPKKAASPFLHIEQQDDETDVQNSS